MRLASLRSVQLSNTCWAFAKIGNRADALFEGVAGQYELIIGNGNLQYWSNTCWAFATVGFNADMLFKCVAAEHLRLVRDGTAQQVVNIMWSFAILGYLNKGRNLVEILWKRVCDGRLVFNNEQLQQLAWFYVAAQIEVGEGFDFEPPPEFLLGLIKEAAAREDDDDVVDDEQQPREHQEVSDTLTELGIDHEMEVSSFVDGDVNNMLNIDIGFSNFNGYNKFAIEFNGPSEYVRRNGLEEVENGRTKLKRRLLGRLGFTVVGINWDEWRRAREGGTQEEYLLNLIMESM